MTLSEDNIYKEADFSDGEKDLIAGAETGVASQMNKTRVLAEIYITKKLEAAIGRLIEANTRLSTSNDRYAKAMNWLTFFLLVVAALQLYFGVTQSKALP